jgi:hypothetical protein
MLADQERKKKEWI